MVKVFHSTGEVRLEEKVRTIEYSLAKELGVKHNGEGAINPNDVSIGALWDYVEEHPKHWFDKWVWP